MKHLVGLKAGLPLLAVLVVSNSYARDTLPTTLKAPRAATACETTYMNLQRARVLHQSTFGHELGEKTLLTTKTVVLGTGAGMAVGGGAAYTNAFQNQAQVEQMGKQIDQLARRGKVIDERYQLRLQKLQQLKQEELSTLADQPWLAPEEKVSYGTVEELTAPGSPRSAPQNLGSSRRLHRLNDEIIRVKKARNDAFAEVDAQIDRLAERRIALSAAQKVEQSVVDGMIQGIKLGTKVAAAVAMPIAIAMDPKDAGASGDEANAYTAHKAKLLNLAEGDFCDIARNTPAVLNYARELTQLLSLQVQEAQAQSPVGRSFTAESSHSEVVTRTDEKRPPLPKIDYEKASEELEQSNERFLQQLRDKENRDRAWHPAFPAEASGVRH